MKYITSPFIIKVEVEKDGVKLESAPHDVYGGSAWVDYVTRLFAGEDNEDGLADLGILEELGTALLEYWPSRDAMYSWWKKPLS